MGAFSLLGASVSPNCNHWTKDHNTSLTSLLGRMARARAGLVVSVLLGSGVAARGPAEGGTRSPPASLNLDGPHLPPQPLMYLPLLS